MNTRLQIWIIFSHVFISMQAKTSQNTIEIERLISIL